MVTKKEFLSSGGHYLIDYQTVSKETWYNEFILDRLGGLDSKLNKVLELLEAPKNES